MTDGQSSDEGIFSALAMLGAGDFAHLNGTVEQHFVGVHNLLTSWGADQILRRAGLFHAAYGTAGFTAAMISLDQRQRISGLIGTVTEKIVYTYCACDRSVVWPQIACADTVIFKDRFNGAEYLIADADLRSFCELTCANEVEIALANRAFVTNHGAKLLRLFQQWHRWLTPDALQAAERIFEVDRR